MTRNPPCICYDMHLPTAPPDASMSISQKIALVTSKMWQPGDKLTVAFMGGNSTQRQHVVDVVNRLMQVANIKFELVSGTSATVRIAFNPSLGAWSYIGKDILGISRQQPTMNLGFDQPGTYTHEFCHSLAAIHEHQSPFGNPIQWNKPQVYHDLGGPPNNWDRATIDNNMFLTYDQTQMNGTQFDPKSIMLYSFPASWTVDGFHVDQNAALSAEDIRWLQTKYPGVSTPTPPVPPVPPVPPTGRTLTLSADLKAGTYSI